MPTTSGFVLEAQRQDELLADVVRRQQLERLGIDLRLVRRLERQAQRLGQRREDLRLAGGVHRQQDLREALARRLRLDRSSPGRAALR